MSITQQTMERHWLPFTDNRSFKREPRLFVRASGMHYWNERGDRILDGSSGLFTSAAGHCRPEIAKAVGEQLQTLDFTPSFMRGHPSAFRLADEVAALMPAGLGHIFFCNSGSESIDTAMKIAMAYHLARGEGQRSHFVSRERAYHGVNIGGTALSGMVRNREAFGALLPGVLHMRHTLLPENRLKRGQGDVGVELADDLLRFMRALFHGEVLGDAALEEMLAIPTVSEGAFFGIDGGLGINRFELDDGTECWAGYGYFGTAMVHCPDYDLTYASTMNQSEADDPDAIDVAVLSEL